VAVTYDSISTYTVSGGSTSTINFSSITQEYTDLIFIFNGSQTGGSNMAVRFNNDASNVYSEIYYVGGGSSTVSGKDVNQTQAVVNFVNTTNNRSMVRIHIPNYSASVMRKSFLFRRDDTFNATQFGIANWNNTSAITTVSFIQTVGASYFTDGTTIALYGLKAA
jgi:hypothetical protein